MSRLRQEKRAAARGTIDVPTVVDQLHVGLELFKHAQLGKGGADLSVKSVETHTEGPFGINKRFRNALHVVYESGEEFYVMVTEIPKGGADGSEEARAEEVRGEAEIKAG
jgi:hypothetical protein